MSHDRTRLAWGLEVVTPWLLWIPEDYDCDTQMDPGCGDAWLHESKDTTVAVDLMKW